VWCAIEADLPSCATDELCELQKHFQTLKDNFVFELRCHAVVVRVPLSAETVKTFAQFALMLQIF